jgi:hypothetical protein
VNENFADAERISEIRYRISESREQEAGRRRTVTQRSQRSEHREHRGRRRKEGAIITQRR